MEALAQVEANDYAVTRRCINHGIKLLVQMIRLTDQWLSLQALRLKMKLTKRLSELHHQCKFMARIYNCLLGIYGSLSTWPAYMLVATFVAYFLSPITPLFSPVLETLWLGVVLLYFLVLGVRSFRWRVVFRVLARMIAKYNPYIPGPLPN